MLPRALARTTSVVLTVLGAVAVLVLALAVAGPVSGQLRFASVVSGSMAPAIEQGALVVSRPVAVEDVREGDVITFTAPGGALYTHRVVDIRSDDGARVLRTKGDANDVADDWQIAADDDALWRTSISVPKVGQALIASRATRGFDAAAVVVPLLLGAVVIVGIWSRPEEVPSA